MKLVQKLALSVLGIATISLSYGMSSTPEVPSQPNASGYSGDVTSLAQGCFSIQSPATGNYLNRFDQGGTVDDGLSYHFENIPVAEAAQFYIKPTGPDGFLLTDKKDGRYLASHLPAAVSAGTYAGEFAEWEIEKDSDNNFSFKNTALLMKLGHKTNKGSLYFQSFLDFLSLNSETAYRLVVQNDCTAFPEVTTNVSGSVDGLKGNINNCGLNDYCTRETIETQLQEIYALGVRTLDPTHKFDNQLAGSAVEDGFISLG
ncbi:hypothetical protein [Thalassolituus sp.]|uniref:hypothetical protein n=1 Tax=Thalassolituus sp. TaxID=2030822 RepID=UPI002A81E929|nr:hypothetical protein [Thalassolituus sp.]